MEAFLWLLLSLVLVHFLADYPLQGDFLATAKNRNTEVGKIFWKHALTAHSVIHGGLVAMVTGSLILGLAETIIHGVTDFLKCENKISLNTDQAIHISCKVVWAIICIGEFL